MGVPISWHVLEIGTGRFPWRSPGGFWCPDLPDGAAQWSSEAGAIVGIHYVCPCGCKDWRSIPVTRDRQTGRGWGWDGDHEKPTLTPSILHTLSPGSGNCGWHGYLTAGEWLTC